MPVRLAVVVSAWLGVLLVVADRTDAARVVDATPTERIVFAQVPADSAVDATRDFPRRELGIPDGSRVVLFDARDGEGMIRVLSEGFLAAGRPRLSWDGRQVLFVGRRTAGETLGVWETNLEGDAARRVVGRAGDCFEAIYLSTLYTIDADSPVPRICYRSRTDRGVDALFTSRLDGSEERRITFNPLGGHGPLLLSDGRLLFSNPVRNAGTALFAVGVDGTDVQAFAGVHEEAALRSMPCETASGHVVFVETAVDRATAGSALVEVPLTRSLRRSRRIVRETAGEYHSPAALPGDLLLISYRPTASESFDLWLLEANTGRRLKRIVGSADWHEVHASPVTARPVPAGRSSVVNYGESTGRLYGLDAFLSDRVREGRIEKERIHKLEILKAVTSPSESPRETVLGTVPVEQDGSFFVELPAQTPLRLRAIDAQGDVSFSMENWIWVMPRESRGCIGCHEDRELTPPNRHVLALRKPPHLLR